MFRIDSDGATIDDKFTEGDPSLSIPATVVSDDWLNHVQEEIAQFIEFNGIVLSKLDDTQLIDAMLEFFKTGGRQAPITQALANNSGPFDVAGLTFDKTVVKSAAFLMDIERKTDTQNVQETGWVFITYDTNDDEFRISPSTAFDDAGVILTIVLDAGDVWKVQATTNDLTGTTYSGNLKATTLTEIRQ